MRIVKEFFIYGMSGALSKMITVLLVPVYTRVLTTADYGVIGLSYTILAACSILCDLQLTSAMGRFFYDKDHVSDRGLLLGTGIISLLVLSCCLGIGLLFSASALADKLFSMPHYKGVFWLMSAQLPLSVCYAYLLYLLRLLRRAQAYLICTVTCSLLIVATSILLVLMVRLGVFGIIWGQLIGTGVGACLCIWFCRKEITWAFDGCLLKKMLRFGLPSVPAVAGNWLQVAMGHAFLLSFMTLSDIGIYSISQRIALGVGLYQMAFGQAWFPFAMSIMDADDNKDKYAAGLFVYMLFGTLILIPIALFAPEIVRLLTGPGFHTASSTLAIICFAILGDGVVITGSLGIMIKKKTYHYSVAYVASVLVNAIVVYLTIRQLGVLSVALGLMLGRWTHALIVFAISQRIYPIDHNIRMLLVVISVALVSILFSQMCPSAGVIIRLAVMGISMGVLFWTAQIALPKKVLVAAGNVFHLLGRTNR